MRSVASLLIRLSDGPWNLQKKKGIKRAAFCSAAAAMLVQGFSIPKLIEDGIIDKEGIPTKMQTIMLSPTMPAINTAQLVWACLGNMNSQKLFFSLMVKNNQSMKLTDWLLCNSAYELEPGAFNLAPHIISNRTTFPSRIARPDITNGTANAFVQEFKDSEPSGYICDIWKVGLGFNKDGNGIITRGEIKNKVDQLLSYEEFKATPLELKKTVVNSTKEGGSSYQNFKRFIEWIKAYVVYFTTITICI
ncbi:UDP-GLYCOSYLTRANSFERASE 83A1 [Salix purpurea]|uniref:UDP-GLYCOSYLTRANSFERASE 83A1 n=1 Tax=Salix purpurea TaxID=77065 RepID=A0A9Q1ACK7_SALPP|nr:UDP-GLYCOSYLTRANSFERASE 83A1 [Salix purpurea]